MKYFFKNIIASLIPIKLITNNYNPVLLYHSLGSNSEFEDNIDHVNLEILNNQLKSIQKYWKFVCIDEYVNTTNKKGLASLTIDDGYKSVIDESLKVFKNLNIPITIFINSSTFEGKIFCEFVASFLNKVFMDNRSILVSLSTVVLIIKYGSSYLIVGIAMKYNGVH